MTAPVDVLSVLREMRETHVRANGAVMSDHDGSLARIDAAVAAVAELIDADLACESANAADDAFAFREAMERRATALARVGGVA